MSKMDGWMIGGLVGTGIFTNVLMVWLKGKFPEWQRKAWAPPLIGMLTTILGALVADQAHSWKEVIVWGAAGLGAGGAASSARDIYAGK